MTVQQSLGKATSGHLMPRNIEAAARHNAGIDALRGSITLLVVFHHTAITYGAIGGWFYREVATDSSLSSSLLVFFCTVNQAFFMGLFFLLAGYYTPAALRSKGPARFMLDRLVRLGLPTLFFGWVLGPMTIALAQTHQGRPFLGSLLRLWERGTFEIGPLWFAEALLIFAAGAALVSLLPAHRWLEPSSEADARPLPSDRVLAAAAIATGAASAALRSEWPVGVNVWNLQLGYFSSYDLLFVVGCLAARPHWLERLPAERVRRWRRIAGVTLPVLPAVYFLGRIIPELQGRTLDLVYAFWEPLVAWGLIMSLLAGFQRRFDRLEGTWRALARRAYTFYIIYPPVLVAVALAWADVPANSLVKFTVTGTVTCILCFVIAGWLVRVPVLRRVL